VKKHPFRPKTAQPFPGNLMVCPRCGHRRLDFMSWEYAACERRGCGYEWNGTDTTLEDVDKLAGAALAGLRRGQMHLTEQAATPSDELRGE
jgi:hypothetical protein